MSSVQPITLSGSNLPGYSVHSLIFDGDPTRIYRAKRLSDGQPVMLKSITGNTTVKEARACLRHEFEMTRRLQVSSVIKVYSLEEFDQVPVVVLEDFGGESLNNLIKARRFSLQEVLEIAIKLANGLGEIHAANIIHKDINPSNLVYNPESGILKIIDFGISTNLTREQAAIANPQIIQASLPYVSPEQTGRMNRSIDYRTDYYSFGVTLYELLTGRRLFNVYDTLEWFHAHIARQPKSPHDLDPVIPLAVSDITMKLLAKMAEDRYQSSAGIVHDLQRCLDQLQKSGTVEPFEPGENDAPGQFQIPQRLYGRKAEVDQLLRAFDRISQGKSEMMLVSGYSGIGKTCVIKEIYKPVTERQGNFVSGKFDQLHRSVPYSAIASALRELVRQLLTESEEGLARWKNKILQAVGKNGQLMIDIIRELEYVIGPQEPLQMLPAMESEQRFHLVFYQFIRVFAKPDHPLVMFLDDLQWADNASLRIIELLTNPELDNRNLFIIGAYRNNEVKHGHPLLTTIKEIQRKGAVVNEIRLAPLSHANLVELLSDTFKCDAVEVGVLAELVELKTTGNPFFVEEFLKFLHQENLISFNSDQHKWVWDLEQIQSQNMTDNLISLMTERLRKLPESTLELLELAACIGNRFRLATLAVISRFTPSLIASQLQPAISEGVIAPIYGAYQLLELDEDYYEEVIVEFAFAHDRIQHAAYSLLSNTRKQQVHLKIGRLLLPVYENKPGRDRLFEVTNHLNIGLVLITDTKEREQLCHLNVEAGHQAKSSTAYHAAMTFFNYALELSGHDLWHTNYETALRLHSEAAESAYLTHQDELMETLISKGIQNSASLADATLFHQIKVSFLTMHGDLKEAVDYAKPILNQLGYYYPKVIKPHHLLLEIIRIRFSMRKTKPKALLNLPVMEDPNTLAANKLGTDVARSALFVEPLLMALMVIKCSYKQFRYGIDPETISAWGTYGMIVATELKKPAEGVAIGKTSLEMIDKFGSHANRCRTLHVYNGMIRYWHEPLRNCLQPLEDVSKMAMEYGDFEYAALPLSVHGLYSVDAGADLQTWQEDLVRQASTIQFLNQPHTLEYIRVYQQACDNLMGNVDHPSRLEGRYFEYKNKLAEFQESGDLSLSTLSNEYSFWIAYMLGDLDYAYEIVSLHDLQNQMTGGFFREARTHLFNPVIRFEYALQNPDKINKSKLLRINRRKLSDLKRSSDICPANFLNKYSLLQAMFTWYEEQDELKATEFFDRAILQASEQGFLQEQALASELCAKMHLASGRNNIASMYLEKALNTYRDWGATAKVELMKQQYPHLLHQNRTKLNTRDLYSTSTTKLASIDITSLMKSLKAIADEKVHSRMVEVIIKAAVEFAGAQIGYLILRNAEGKFCIEGETDVQSGDSRILQSIPVSQDNIPMSLFNFVCRTKSSLVVEDAQHPNETLQGLNQDIYVQTARVRSVLCMPIISGSGEESELTGVIYLENNLASGTFTQERFDTLEIIGMAAAGRLELSRKAAFDGLTGLFNHEYFQNMLTMEMASAIRHKRELALILIDIDHFKTFNDKWGHQVGDMVLKDVARLIRQTCRSSDIVARYGGEEMVVILPSTLRKDAEEVGERIREAVDRHCVQYQQYQLRVTISLGLAMLQPQKDDKESLIHRADKLLYHSKENGRNRLTSDRVAS